MVDSRHNESPTTQPQIVFLKDYRAPDFSIDMVHMRFDLFEEFADVRTVLQIRRNAGAAADEPLSLCGEELELLELAVNDVVLGNDEYQLDSHSLVIAQVPDAFTLTCVTRLRPHENTSLTGLYKSSGNFCTQCEAEGFRRITYFLDRPDVLARFTVRICADRRTYPVLLSNGNCVAKGDLDGGRHWVEWNDPFPKPSYLFALVAGDLACVEDEFVTCHGRRVALEMYVQHHNKDQCAHAMASLKKAMRWDEEVYGREYDLDVYMIVAVDDFNMGAMENKGLNIFNSKYVLAQPETATDADYLAIEGVIAHEYFHNWSGNRVTCRDWFQLSLKEGFTVFRDQEFTADMNSRGVKRIDDVNLLRTHQFREDAGPMAHPVRPASYIEINNFYTVTVYNKGAEVVRMLHHLVGADVFRKGTDLYFSRHDGQAVTTDDFVAAIEQAGGYDLRQFKRWYEQAGTPRIRAFGEFDAKTATYTLTLEQQTPPTPGQDEKLPFQIPVAMALFAQDGARLPLKLKATGASHTSEIVLDLHETRQSFVFYDIHERPVPSLLRGFSAPVKLATDLADDELMFLMRHDDDDFNRWEAAQRVSLNLLLNIVNAAQKGQSFSISAAYYHAMEAVLTDARLDKAFAAQMLTLPNESYIAEFCDVIDPDAIHDACLAVRRGLAENLYDLFWKIYADNVMLGPYEITPQAMGRRALRNTSLGYLIEMNDDKVRAACVEQFSRANNMTDVLAAMSCLVNVECLEKTGVLDEFYDKWDHDPLVMDKWLRIQATSRLDSTLENVRHLMAHPAFNIKNPNKVRSLVGSFAMANQVRFHDASGAGYRLVADVIIQLNTLNPQVAARLATAFALWRKYDSQRQGLMRAELQRIAEVEGLKRDVYEIVSRSLA